jgi:hypothetical protein
MTSDFCLLRPAHSGAARQLSELDLGFLEQQDLVGLAPWIQYQAKPQLPAQHHEVSQCSDPISVFASNSPGYWLIFYIIQDTMMQTFALFI